MGLLNGLITILAVEILFFKMDMWHANAIRFVDNPSLLKLLLPLKLKRDDATRTSNDSKCNEMIRKVQLVPYTETYRYRPIPEYDMRAGMPITYSHIPQIKTRLNYKKEFHTELTCCEGYVQSGTVCVPRCPRSCEKGACREPDVCTCDKGYRMSSNGSCVPECTNGCVNGTCVDPEVCSCNDGYWMDADGFTCRPVCDAKCERNHRGYCSEPNVCTCYSGYRRINNESSTFACEPVCDRECVRCVTPNVCVHCADGYELDESYGCKPRCDEPCVFGTCTAPGICSCNKGYKYKNGSRHTCEPICECDVRGTCTEFELCSCKTGFVYDKTSETCKPHCATACGPNEECTSPNECTCLEGYNRSNLHIVQLHERMLGKPVKIRFISQLPKPICQPVCDFNCINGRCTAPNVCTCDPNHYPSWIEFHQPLDNKTSHVCVQLVGPPCTPDSCGDYGTCHESGVCVCNDGYAKDTDGVCVPFCAQGCSNGGECTAPNRCTCQDGFALRNGSFCEPVCERGCQNGDCVGPNRCVCHDDFVPSTDHRTRPECIPVCTRNCSGHGECRIVEHDDYSCECHFGWTGRDCDQPTVCVITMAYDHDGVNRITIRNDTNSTIMRAYENAPFCYQCDNSFDNETLCYVMQLDEDNTTNIGCLLSIDLPCYTPHYIASINVTIIVWPFVILAILLLTALAMTAYLMYRKHQKKKLAIAGTPTNIFVRESLATEFLLPDI